jgi:hypothetical protein
MGPSLCGSFDSRIYMLCHGYSSAYSLRCGFYDTRFRYRTGYFRERVRIFLLRMASPLAAQCFFGRS